MKAVHKVSDFKPKAGKIFDAAKKSPQYVVRDGVLLVIRRTEQPGTEMMDVVADTWEKLGPPPDIDYDEL